MSTTIIIALVSGGLFIMIAVAYIMQLLEKQAKERRRLEAALKARARNFQYMLDSFPPDFLTRDLKILVAKSLLDTYQRLERVGRRSTYAGQREAVNRTLQQLQQEETEDRYQHLTNTAQIGDIQTLLRELYQFAEQLRQSNVISNPEAQLYSLQIRRLLAASSVDALREQAAEALANNKIKLAVHHYRVALEKLGKENADGYFNEMIRWVNARLEELTDKEEEAHRRSLEQQEQAEAEWEDFKKEEEAWKKKAIYD